MSKTNPILLTVISDNKVRHIHRSHIEALAQGRPTQTTLTKETLQAILKHYLFLLDLEDGDSITS